MIELSIYLDEAGTPPGRDSDELFIVSGIGVPNRLGSKRVKPRPSPAETIEYLRAWQAITICIAILPHQGYGIAIDRKQKLARFMITEDMKRGREREFFTKPEHVNYRNMIYQQALSVAVGNLMVDAALMREETIATLRVFADQKTMGPGLREVGDRTIAQAGDFGRQQFRRRSGNPTLTHRERAQFRQAEWMIAVPKERSTIQWSDEAGFDGERIGLDVADGFASHVRADLLTRVQRKPFAFSASMAGLGYQDRWIQDVTNIVTMHAALDYVAHWEKETGISVPRELLDFA